jgi:formylglycine-generating enzyme required for sulfatase activity
MPYWSVEQKAHPDWAWACNWDKPGREDHPINCVTWQQAQTYCQWVGRRLPTEAEWEKAARGTDGRKYPWGNRDFKLAGRVANIADATAKRNRLNWVVATWYDDGFYETAPIGSFPSGASPYGALDMSGNVWEWTADWSDSEHRYRSLRGGSWSDLPRFARASSRLRNAPGDRYMVVGFRCVQ